MISIHRRVFLSAMLTLCLFLGLSIWFLDDFFKTHVEKNMQDSLQNHIYSLLASANEDELGRMRLPDILPNPSLNQPDSGIRAYVYGENNNYHWSSASAINADFNPQIISSIKTGETIYSILQNNYSRMVFAIKWEDFQSIQQNYIIVVEIKRTEMDQQIADFRYQLGLWIGGSSFVLLVALILVLNWSLKPLRQAVLELKQIQQGEKSLLSYHYPQELLLLTNNINQLIQLSATRLQRYRNSLGDLTHSLKTPLAIIQGAYDSNNQQQLRTAISEQLGRFNELVQYQLQRASIAGESAAFLSIEINPLVKKIIRSLDKVYADKQLKCHLKMAAGISFRGDEGDLMELLGNLLDNAYKFCNTQVDIKIEQTAQQLCLSIEDDGPGIDKNLYTQFLQRGKRADSLTPGHGIGLGIVNDIIRQYHGKIKLSRSQGLNGLQVLIIMPLVTI
jgi:two-component system, OmpR family, sensor histidine kinase PhoQ